VALAVCSLLWITVIEFNLELNTNLMLFVFFASITGYNFVKYFGLAKFHHRHLANWLKLIQLFSLFSFAGLCYFGLQLEFKTLVYIAGFGVVTFLYAIPFLPKRIFLEEGNNLRAISGLKIYIIAFVWVGITVVLPVVDQGYPLELDIIITVIQRYLYVLVAMLPFEIRDMQFDNLKLSTIPQQIGVNRTKHVGALLLIAFFIMEFFKDETSIVQFVILAVVSLVLGLFLMFSQIKQRQYYSSFLVEGIPVFWLAIMLLLS